MQRSKYFIEPLKNNFLLNPSHSILNALHLGPISNFHKLLSENLLAS